MDTIRGRDRSGEPNQDAPTSACVAQAIGEHPHLVGVGLLMLVAIGAAAFPTLS